MNSKDLIKAGQLSDARKQLIEEVKSSPSDLSKRTLLFQVLLFCGEWDKAERHLDVIAAQDSIKEVGAQVYKNLIYAERERIEVLKTNVQPSFLPKTPPYANMYFTAWKNLLEGNVDKATEIFDQIYAQLPVISGTLNGKSFIGFKNTDAFLSIFLEVIVHERYLWIPFESIRELSISPPKTFFDLLWVTAHLTMWDGLTMNCYLPVLYPNSFLHDNDQIKLGKMTDWTSLGGSFSKGAGQHVFQIGENETAILEIREIVFETSNLDKK